MAIGFYGGRWLDRRFDTKFLAFVGLIVGIYAGFRTLFKAAKEMQREAEREALRDEQEGRVMRSGAFSSAFEEQPQPPPAEPASPITNARGSRDGDAPS